MQHGRCVGCVLGALFGAVGYLEPWVPPAPVGASVFGRSWSKVAGCLGFPPAAQEHGSAPVSFRGSGAT
eukprot:3540495-Lingulodinium_polyedra.AAC.1